MSALRCAAMIALMAVAMFPACAKDKIPRTWQATRTTDPITGVTSCVVSALDYMGGFRYSRMGFLYPIVEINSRYGLLIGVSSGGNFRLPTGDIVWRVDDKPFRELKAANNPPSVESAISYGDGVAGKAVAEAMAANSKAILAATATSTLASGDIAKEMLAELRAGHGLIYRAAAAAPEYGLPGTAMYRVGQYTKDGLKPVPIDASLEAALAVCDVS